MGSAIFASLLIIACKGKENKTYIWLDTPTDCYSVVMNCAMNKHKDILEKSKDEMKKAIEECPR